MLKTPKNIINKKIILEKNAILNKTDDDNENKTPQIVERYAYPETLYLFIGDKHKIEVRPVDKKSTRFYINNKFVNCSLPSGTLVHRVLDFDDKTSLIYFLHSNISLSTIVPSEYLIQVSRQKFGYSLDTINIRSNLELLIDNINYIKLKASKNSPSEIEKHNYFAALKNTVLFRLNYLVKLKESKLQQQYMAAQNHWYLNAFENPTYNFNLKSEPIEIVKISTQRIYNGYFTPDHITQKFQKTLIFSVDPDWLKKYNFYTYFVENNPGISISNSGIDTVGGDTLVNNSTNEYKKASFDNMILNFNLWYKNINENLNHEARETAFGLWVLENLSPQKLLGIESVISIGKNLCELQLDFILAALDYVVANYGVLGFFPYNIDIMILHELNVIHEFSINDTHLKTTNNRNMFSNFQMNSSLSVNELYNLRGFENGMMLLFLNKITELISLPI